MHVANDLIVAPGGALTGTVVVPGDKSVSHRSVMFGALSDGVCQVSDCLLGEDVLATIDAFRALGVTIDNHGDGRLTVHGVGVDKL